MNRREFLATVGATTVVAGCTGSEGDSTPQDTETSESTPDSTTDSTGQDTPTPSETEDSGTSETADLVNMTDHYFEKFAVEDVNAFVTVENISDKELTVVAEISVFEDNQRLANMEGRVQDLPPGISEEISNITLLDLDEPDRITRYVIEVRACEDGFSCEDASPIEMDYDGDEFRERLEGEWT